MMFNCVSHQLSCACTLLPLSVAIPIWEVLGLDFSKINLSVLLNTMFIIEAMMELQADPILHVMFAFPVIKLDIICVNEFRGVTLIMNYNGH